MTWLNKDTINSMVLGLSALQANPDQKAELFSGWFVFEWVFHFLIAHISAEICFKKTRFYIPAIRQKYPTK